MTSFPERGAGDRRHLLTGMGMLALAGLALAPDRRDDSAPVVPQARRRTFPNPVLLTQDGKAVRFYDDMVRDRIVLLNMTYLQCSNICPPMTANLLQVQQRLGRRAGRDVFMVSISLLPEHDTPQALREYMQRYRIGRGWTFLTGRPADVEQVRLALGFFDLDPVVDADRSQHTGMVRIGNDALDRWCMNPALAEPEQICESIRAVDPLKRPFDFDRRANVLV